MDCPTPSDMQPEWAEAATVLLDRGWTLVAGGSDCSTLHASHGAVAVAVVPLPGWNIVKAEKYYPPPDGWVGGHTWHSAVRKAIRPLGPDGEGALASIVGYRDIGDRLAAARLRLGLTYAAAAAAIGVNPSTLYGYECGAYEPGPERLERCESWLMTVG